MRPVAARLRAISPIGRISATIDAHHSLFSRQPDTYVIEKFTLLCIIRPYPELNGESTMKAKLRIYYMLCWLFWPVLFALIIIKMRSGADFGMAPIYTLVVLFWCLGLVRVHDVYLKEGLRPFLHCLYKWTIGTIFEVLFFVGCYLLAKLFGGDELFAFLLFLFLHLIHHEWLKSFIKLDEDGERI